LAQFEHLRGDRLGVGGIAREDFYGNGTTFGIGE